MPWPLKGMFCLPDNIMVLMIALSAFIFFSLKHLLVLLGNPVWQGCLWFLNTSDYGNAGFECQLVTAFSDDTEVPHLSQWLFLAFGMELLLETFSVLVDFMDYYASHNICKNLSFVKDYIQATYTFPTMRAETQAFGYVCLSS